MKQVYILWVHPFPEPSFIEGVYAHKIDAERDMRLLSNASVQEEGNSRFTTRYRIQEHDLITGE